MQFRKERGLKCIIFRNKVYEKLLEDIEVFAANKIFEDLQYSTTTLGVNDVEYSVFIIYRDEFEQTKQK